MKTRKNPFSVKHPVVNQSNPIAIIGIGCRFPGNANSAEQFWSLLTNGIDAIQEVPKDRWDMDTVYDPDFTQPGKLISRFGGFVDAIGDFDPHVFGISPKEALMIDPQQRLLLEVTHHTLEHARVRPSSLAGSSTGVFIGISSHDYSDMVSSSTETRLISPYSNTGGALSIAANRISYTFDLRGPSLAVDTACSSSLVALHYACLAMDNKECGQALVGGVNALLRRSLSLGFSRGGFLSPTGRCRAFDEMADGYVRSEGAGMVLIKPLADAENDGDRIIAVIRGTAVNQDGRTEGLSLPNVESQVAMLRRAYKRAQIKPQDVGYVEAHGTGTPVGDPIEARALGEVLGASRVDDEPCYIGSVKTNIGHLEAGSGIAGLIKLALILDKGMIPPNLHATRPNPTIPFADLGLLVVDKLTNWPDYYKGNRIGAVNSFGFGGTNAHAVLESHASEQSTKKSAGCNKCPQPVAVALSAASDKSLDDLIVAHKELAQNDTLSIRDLAWSTIKQRDSYTHRTCIIARNLNDYRDLLQKYGKGIDDPDIARGRCASGSISKIGFVFSGQGSQWWAMGRQLLKYDSVFRSAIEECDRLLGNYAGWSLLNELRASESLSRIDTTYVAQPALFAIQIALTRRWQALGIMPSAVVGHSIGEVAASVICGALSLEDGIKLVFHRSRIQHKAAGKGKMLVVALTQLKVEEMIHPFKNTVSIAAFNGPGLITLSGDSESIDKIAEEIKSQNIFHRYLRVPIPFHSHHMDGLEAELVSCLEGLNCSVNDIPFYSTVTGSQHGGEELDAEYWFHNMRDTVLFESAVSNMVQDGVTTFLEISPHPVLSSSVEAILRESETPGLVVSSLRRHEDESLTLLRELSKLYVNGYTIEPAIEADHIQLPYYPWQKDLFWAETTEGRKQRIGEQRHPFIRSHMHSASDETDHTWEIQLDKVIDTVLDDHRVQGTVIFPAAGYLDLLIGCAKEIFDSSKVIEISNVHIEKALFLPDGEEPPKVAIELRGDLGRCAVSSRRSGSDSTWMQHVRCYLNRYSEAVLTDIPQLPDLQSRCIHQFDLEKSYDILHKSGLELGSRFRCIEEAFGRRKADGTCREILATVKIPSSLRSSACRHALHPAILDSAFQPLLFAINDGVESPSDIGLYLPAGIDRLVVTPTPVTETLHSYGIIDDFTEHGFTCNLFLFNENGDLIAKLANFRTSYVPGSRKRTADSRYSKYYDPTWLPVEDEDIKLTDSQESSLTIDGMSILVAGTHATADSLVYALRSDGHNVHQTSADSQSIRATLDATVSDDTLPYSLILYFPCAEGPSLVEDVEKLHNRSTGPLLNLVRSITSLKKTAPLSVTVVTSSVHSIRDSDNVTPNHAPLWGLARVIANESSDISVQLIDVLDHLDSHDVTSLAKACTHKRQTDFELALRHGKWYRYRLQPTTESTVRTNSLRSIRSKNEHYRVELGEPGVFESMVLRECGQRSLKEHEIEVEVGAIGINFRDLMMASGLMTPEMWRGGFFGPTIGMEVSGVVTRVGRYVKNFKPSDSVMGPCNNGFSSHVCMPAELTVRRPDCIAAEEAAGLGVAYTTAYHALVKIAHLQAGERVLIHAAAGGVGIAAVQIAQWIGAEVFATVGNDDKRAFLEKMGVEHIMNSRSLDFAKEVLSATGGSGVDVVLNSLSGRAITRSLACLTPYGRFVEIGKSDIFNNARIGLLHLAKNISLHVFDLDKYLIDRPQDVHDSVLKAMRLRESGHLGCMPYSTIHISKIGEAFRAMSRSQHTGKLIVVNDDSKPILAAPDLSGSDIVKSDKSYIITGGTSGLGVQICQWLLSSNAGHVVLMSRTGGNNNPELAKLLSENTAQASRITILAVDVADKDALTHAYQHIKSKLPPLAGVIHGAMELEDGLINQMSDEQFLRVLRPKIGGTINLHLLTHETDLDFFVMLSSVSSIFGNPGQANYSAANAYLDAFTHYRLKHQLAATTANFGVLGNTGIAASTEGVIERLAAQGWHAMPAKQAVSMLSQTIRDRSPQRVIADIDWRKVSSHTTSDNTRSRFSDILSSADAVNDNASSQLAAEIALLPGKQRSTYLAKTLRTQLACILGMSEERILLDEPLTKFGIDSLMATQFNSWLTTRLGVEISLMKILQGPSLIELSEILLSRIISYSSQEASQTSLICYSRRNSASVNLLCFPHIGADASMYAPWSDSLPDNIEVYGIDMPVTPSINGSTPQSHLDHFIQSLCSEFEALPDRPFVIYGHSLGAFLAWEFAKKVDEIHIRRPSHLFVGAWRAPHINEIEIISSQYPPREDESREAWLKRWVREQLGLPEATIDNPQMLSMLDKTDESTLSASFPITAFHGINDSMYTKEHVSAWRQMTSSQFNFVELDAPHLFLEHSESRQHVIKTISEACTSLT